jgi:hypothetical protein
MPCAAAAAEDNSSQNSNIEQQKLAVERQKLEVERSKAAWSAVATIVPLLAALGTLIYSVWSFRKQTGETARLHKEAAIETARLQNESAKLQFEIKAAEIAFSGKTPEAVRNRAKVLKTIFGQRLPENFPPEFDPKTYGGGKETPEEKMFFLELLLKYPGKEKEIVEGWDTLFGDAWLARVKPLILEESDTLASEPGGVKKELDESRAEGTDDPAPHKPAAGESGGDKADESQNQTPSTPAPKAEESPSAQQPDTNPTKGQSGTSN